MRIFILEDEIYKFPRKDILKALEGHRLTVALSVDEGKKVFNPPYDLLLLDHDMRGFYEESDAAHGNTGWWFAQWLAGRDMPPMKIILHSQNGVGRRNMKELLERRGFDVEEFEFCREYVRTLNNLGCK